MIDTIRDQTGAGIRRICSVLSLPRSSYYQASQPTKIEREDQQIGDLIEQIFHSDRGSQYGSRSFRAVLRTANITQSMSRRANPYDNAWTESFIGTLKSDMLDGCQFIDERDARSGIFSYIDGYYNTVRKHSALGYLSPSEFEKNHYVN